VREKITPADLVTVVVTLPSIAERPASSEERKLICPRAVQGYLEDGHGLCGTVAARAAARAGAVAALDVNERAKMATFKAEAVAAGPTAFVLKVGSFGKRSVELTMQDFMSIRDRRWVTDRVVNGYFTFLNSVQTGSRGRAGLLFRLRPSSTIALWAMTRLKTIQTRASLTFAARKDGRRIWTRYSACACQDGCWCLSTWGACTGPWPSWTFAPKTITYYDSFFDSERSSRVLATLMRWLREYAAMDAAANGCQQAIDVSEWTSVSSGRSVPQRLIYMTAAYTSVTTRSD
jgi:hypothetical protein